MGFIPGVHRFFNICKSINVIHHINKLKDKNHMIISIDAEKALTKFNTHLWLKKKNFPESRHRRNIPQHYKSHIWQTHSKHYSQWQKAESISSKIRNNTEVPTLATIQHSFKSPSTAVRDEKEIKVIQTGKEEVKLTVCRWHDPLHRKP